MTQQNVTITVNNRPYTLSCAPHEQARLIELAGVVDGRLQSLKQQLGDISGVSDSHLLVLNALMMADELAEKATPVMNPDEYALVVRAVSHLTDRVINIAGALKTR